MSLLEAQPQASGPGGVSQGLAAAATSHGWAVGERSFPRVPASPPLLPEALPFPTSKLSPGPDY